MKLTVYWRTGKRQVIEGPSVEKAFALAGIQRGALPAVDFYANGDNDEYVWDTKSREWLRKKPIFNPEGNENE